MTEQESQTLKRKNNTRVLRLLTWIQLAVSVLQTLPSEPVSTHWFAKFECSTLSIRRQSHSFARLFVCCRNSTSTGWTCGQYYFYLVTRRNWLRYIMALLQYIDYSRFFHDVTNIQYKELSILMNVWFLRRPTSDSPDTLLLLYVLRKKHEGGFYRYLCTSIRAIYALSVRSLTTGVKEQSENPS